MATLVQIRNQLRMRVGYPTATVLLPTPADPNVLSPDESPLDVALSDALRAVNKHWPIYGVGSFVTVADQQVYQPLPAGAQRLIEVFWSDLACDAALDRLWPAGFVAELDGYLGEYVEAEGGLRFSPMPAALTIMQRQASTLRRYFGRTSVRTDRDSVYLIPTPSVAGTTVYFVYATDRFASVTDVAEDPTVKDAFWAAAEAAAHRFLSVGAGAVTETVGPDGTKIKVDSRAHERAAAVAEQKFVDNLPPPLGWW